MNMGQTVADIAARLAAADEEQFAVLERALAADTRKGVAQALARARRRLDSQAALSDQTDRLYRFQREAAGTVAARLGRSSAEHGSDNGEWVCAVGLDEVGRGPLAGPLTVGAVVLPETPHIVGLNDSKRLTPARREQLDGRIRQVALAWDIEHIPPQDIDERGMTACLKAAFGRAIAAIDEHLSMKDGYGPVEAVLLDGNPLHLDRRELNIVKGDARVAAIAAASIIAKVARDRLMVDYAAQYPGYGFDRNKGYGSQDHIEAIGRLGLSPIHRKTFCTNFTQQTLF